MKRNHILLFTLCNALLLLAACRNGDDETATNKSRELTKEALTRHEPVIVSIDEFKKTTHGIYYAECKLFLCSDSLGKVCFWDRFDHPTFDMEKGEYYHDLDGNSCQLLRFFESDGSCYMPRIPGYTYERPAYRFYWCYDEEDGTFGTSTIPITADSFRGERLLMDVTTKYMIVKVNSPIRPSNHATYTLIAYLAVDENEAARRWYPDADDADKDLSETTP